MFAVRRNRTTNQASWFCFLCWWWRSCWSRGWRSSPPPPWFSEDVRTQGHKYTLNCTQSATETQWCHLLTGSGTTARGNLSRLLETQLETNDFHQNTSQRYKNSFTFFILYNLNILLNISQLKSLSGLGSDWTSCDCSVTDTHDEVDAEVTCCAALLLMINNTSAETTHTV